MIYPPSDGFFILSCHIDCCPNLPSTAAHHPAPQLWGGCSGLKAPSAVASIHTVFRWSHQQVFLLSRTGTFKVISSYFGVMGGSQSRVRNHHYKEHAVPSSRLTFKSWLLRHRQKNKRRHSKCELTNPVETESAPWVRGHKVFVVLEDGQGAFVHRDALWYCICSTKHPFVFTTICLHIFMICVLHNQGCTKRPTFTWKWDV